MIPVAPHISVRSKHLLLYKLTAFIVLNLALRVFLIVTTPFTESMIGFLGLTKGRFFGCTSFRVLGVAVSSEARLVAHLAARARVKELGKGILY